MRRECAGIALVILTVSTVIANDELERHLFKSADNPFMGGIRDGKPLQQAATPFSSPLPEQQAITGQSIGSLSLDDVKVPVRQDEGLVGQELLGQFIFFDTTLSDPATTRFNGKIHAGEACATCHNEDAGSTIGEADVNLKFGVAPGVRYPLVGKRKVPSSAYIAFSPNGPTTNAKGIPQFGGMWDGRNLFPILNVGALMDSQEQANKSVPSDNPRLRNGYSPLVAQKLQHRPYTPLWLRLNGRFKDDEDTFLKAMQAIDTYLQSDDVNSFTSKFDAVAEGRRGVQFTDSEWRGQNLFRINCQSCHSSEGLTLRIKAKHNLFTSFQFFNIGLPKNNGNPFYQDPNNAAGVNFIDIGLAGNHFPGKNGERFDIAENMGKFKTPTLRNIAKFDPDLGTEHIKALGHNGGIKSLRQFLNFLRRRNRAHSLTTREEVSFDLRDGPPAGFVRYFDPPEVLDDNIVNVEGVRGRLGNFEFDDDDITDIISYMGTFSDGFFERN